MTVLPGAEPVDLPGGPVGVLLVHGFTGTTQSMRPWAEALAAEAPLPVAVAVLGVLGSLKALLTGKRYA